MPVIFFASHLSSTLTRMSDAERDQIDADAQTFMKTCSEAIKVFKLEGEFHRGLNPSNAKAFFIQSTIMQRSLKTIRSKLCKVGIHRKALAEFFQMSTHVPGLQSFFRVFVSFCIGQICQQQHEG